MRINSEMALLTHSYPMCVGVCVQIGVVAVIAAVYRWSCRRNRTVALYSLLHVVQVEHHGKVQHGARLQISTHMSDVLCLRRTWALCFSLFHVYLMQSPSQM